MKYYIKLTYTNRGEVYYKAHKKAQGWCGNGELDCPWKFSKQGAKKIIERYEQERDFGHNIWAKDAVWELEEAGQ